MDFVVVSTKLTLVSSFAAVMRHLFPSKKAVRLKYDSKPLANVLRNLLTALTPGTPSYCPFHLSEAARSGIAETLDFIGIRIRGEVENGAMDTHPSVERSDCVAGDQSLFSGLKREAYKQVPGTVRHNINVEGTHVGAGRQETSAGDISEILRKRSSTSRECRLPASPAPKPTETQLSMMRLGRVDYLPSKPPADWLRHLWQKGTSGQSERERDKPMERSGTPGST
ncbi:hypothetical protein FB45DRAFT_1004404 [Roridomyces roridus]|uniref:Uncharacterized protein n=1 Tax=Roridomyces roridus TaxID=1738132 RepID=A0AAD7BT33_9AGAR|nr:hypothetical protein FB45DRAFT_1004404 [Roridomyces roridus]